MVTWFTIDFLSTQSNLSIFVLPFSLTRYFYLLKFPSLDASSIFSPHLAIENMPHSKSQTSIFSSSDVWRKHYQCSWPVSAFTYIILFCIFLRLIFEGAGIFLEDIVPEKFCLDEFLKKNNLLRKCFIIYGLLNERKHELISTKWSSQALLILSSHWKHSVCLYFDIIVSLWMLWNANTLSLRTRESRSGTQSRENWGKTPSWQESQRPLQRSLFLHRILSLHAQRYLSFQTSTRHCWAVGLDDF